MLPRVKKCSICINQLTISLGIQHAHYLMKTQTSTRYIIMLQDSGTYISHTHTQVPCQTIQTRVQQTTPTHPPPSTRPNNTGLYPVNMLDLVCIWFGSAQKCCPEAGPIILAHQLASGPDLFGQNLIQSARTKSDLGWFCTVWSRLIERTQPSLKAENWYQAICVRPEPGPMNWFASGPDVFGQNMTRPSR